jgi:hypothetical protein
LVFFLLWTGAHREGRRPWGWRRRRFEHQGARLRHGTGRGDRDEHDGGAHRCGGQRNRPESKSQRRRVSVPGAAVLLCTRGAGGSGRRAASRDGAARAQRLGRRAGPVSPFYGAVRVAPGQGRRRRRASPVLWPGVAAGPRWAKRWAGAGGLGRCGSSPRARPR